MVAFCVDILSPGRPSLFHWATVASSVNMDTGSKPSVMGMGSWPKDKRETLVRVYIMKRVKMNICKTLVRYIKGLIELRPSDCIERASRGSPAALSGTFWRRSQRRR